MPIVNMPPNPPLPSPGVQQLPAQLTDAAYKHALIDIKEIPFAALLTHIEGSSWTVDYYSQVLGQNEALSPYQPGQLPPYQQYLLVHKYEMKLQGALSIGHDSDTGNMSATGTAITYPFLRPNVGDAFLAEIGDGRVGQFTVTASTPRSLMRETVFEISFELSRVADATVVANLGECVVKEGFYKREFLTYGQNPVLLTEQVESVSTIERYRAELLNHWVRAFFSAQYNTIVLPGQPAVTYDHYLTRAMLRMHEVNVHPLMSKIRELNLQDYPAASDFNLWDSLLSLDDSARDLIPQKMSLVPSMAFAQDPRMNSVRYSGIRQVIFPISIYHNVDWDYGTASPVTAGGYVELNDMIQELPSLIADNILDDGSPIPVPGEIPMFHRLLKDDYYVLTQAFYESAPVGQSLLELLVNDLLAARALDRAKLFSLCDAVRRLGRLEEFYYIPLLLILLNVALREI